MNVLHIDNTLGLAAAIVLAMSIAGCAHIVWLKSSLSNNFRQPIDKGAYWRGRRLFGDNKQLRGFMVLPVAAAMSFTLVAQLLGPLPGHAGPLTVPTTLIVGFLAGLAFLLAELPNSLLKRQLDIPSGAAAASEPLKSLFGILDRIDSSIGVLLVLLLFMPLSLLTIFWTVALGVLLHAFFSAVLHRFGVKQRAL